MTRCLKVQISTFSIGRMSVVLTVTANIAADQARFILNLYNKPPVASGRAVDQNCCRNLTVQLWF